MASGETTFTALVKVSRREAFKIAKVEKEGSRASYSKEEGRRGLPLRPPTPVLSPLMHLKVFRQLVARRKVPEKLSLLFSSLVPFLDNSSTSNSSKDRRGKYEGGGGNTVEGRE